MRIESAICEIQVTREFAEDFRGDLQTFLRGEARDQIAELDRERFGYPLSPRLLQIERLYGREREAVARGEIRRLGDVRIYLARRPGFDLPRSPDGVNRMKREG
jgi:hypothetical protein